MPTASWFPRTEPRSAAEAIAKLMVTMEELGFAPQVVPEADEGRYQLRLPASAPATARAAKRRP